MLINHRSRIVLLTAAVTVIVLTLLIYRPGLSGQPLFDDFESIFNNPKVVGIKTFDWPSIQGAALSGNTGPLKRPVSQLSFALNILSTGHDPYYFKLTGLVVHLLTGISLGIFTLLLLRIYRQRYQQQLSTNRIRWLALVTAASWLLHPFNLTGVLYIVQRMTSLSALFVVWGMILYLLGRLQLGLLDSSIHRPFSGWLMMALGVGGCGALAVLSKENGVLLVFYIALIEWLICGFKSSRQSSQKWLISVTLVMVLVSLTVGVIYLKILTPEKLIASYNNRPFTLSQRLMTESRVVWFYIQMTLLPDIRSMGLFHDDILISRSLLQPLTTLAALLMLLVLVTVALLLRQRAPLVTFALLFYLLGQSLESTVVPLELVHGHRNYLSAYALLLILFYYLLHPAVTDRLRYPLPQLFSGLIILLFAISTGFRAERWRDNNILAAAALRYHPDSVSSILMVALPQLTNNIRQLAFEPNSQSVRKELAETTLLLERASQLDDYLLSSHFYLLIADQLNRQSLNQQRLDELKARLKRPPLSSSAITALNAVNNYMIKSRNQPGAEIVAQLYQSILLNPQLGLKWRGRLLAESAKLANYRGKPKQALAQMEEAIRLNSTIISYRLLHTQLLLANGHINAAAAQLKVAQQLDRGQLFSAVIKALKGQLEAAYRYR